MGRYRASGATARDDQPGGSATVEYRRARRAVRRRRPLCAVLAAMAGSAWIATGWLSRPGLAGLGFAAAAGAWAARPEADADRWLRGAAGEAATARLLATLPRRFIVLHDRRVPGGRANIDHLVIGPTGVVVVDSKAYRTELRVGRGRVWAGQYQVPTAPARREAEQVAALLGVAVRPMLAVHGRGLGRRGQVVGGVPVLPAGRLCRWLRRGRRRLSRAQVTSLAQAADRALPPAARPR